MQFDEMDKLKIHYVRIWWGCLFFVVAVVVVALLTQCGTVNVGVQSPMSMSPQERLATAKRLWTSQELDIKAAAERAKAGTITEAEASYYIAKGKRLKEIATMIDIYDGYVKGLPPTPGTDYISAERIIIRFIQEAQSYAK